MKRFYAGIGSRETPIEYLQLFTRVATYLEGNNFMLRSGGAKGADQAFEAGVTDNNYEIYLPWPKFEDKNGIVVENPKAFEIAAKFHPAWDKLSQGAQKLHARNCHQVLGKDLKTLSSFIICYTSKGNGSGGTGQALRIAKAYNVPIFDCGLHSNILECRKELNKFIASFLV